MGELDTGACTNVVSEIVYRRVSKDNSIQKTNRQLCTANGDYLKFLGLVHLNVRLENRKETLQFLVTSDNIKYVILGRADLDSLWPTWRNIFQYTVDKEISINLCENNDKI